MPPRKPVTAAELMSELESDPQWVAQRDARDARRRKQAEELHRDSASLIDDLHRVGIDGASVFDFVNVGVTPPEAFSVLVAHLDQPHMRNVREGIIRALTQRAAKDIAFDTLIRHYQTEADDNLRWVIANALSQMAAFREVGHLPKIAQYRGLFGRA